MRGYILGITLLHKKRLILHFLSPVVELAATHCTMGDTMKNETLIDKEKFIQAIQQGYGFEIANIEFLLRGWGGDCYLVETKKGERYFLKVHDDATYMGTAVTSRDFYLPLMDELFSKRILPRIPHPIKTLDNNYRLGVGSNELVLTNFIEAELVGFGHLPDNVLAQLAEAVGILHRCKALIEIPHPLIEQFEISFEADLLWSIDDLDKSSSDDSPGKRLLKNTLLPYKNKTLDSLQRLKDLQRYAKSTNKAMVICHTDLHGGNLMMDDQGNLYILDWENALIAPPEHDLFFFTGDERFWDIFLPPYERQFGPVSIDTEVLRFYYYRRTLEDIAGFVFRILLGDGGEDRDREDIEWLKGNLTDLENIEKTVSGIQTRFESLK